MVQADFLWLHEMPACCYFRAILTQSKCSFLINGRHSSLLFRLGFTLFFVSPLLGHIYSKSISSSLFSLGKTIVSQNFVFHLLFQDKKFSVQLQIYKLILSPIFLLTYRNSLFSPNSSIIVPLESKQCPLTPAAVLGCAHSVGELRF